MSLIPIIRQVKSWQSEGRKVVLATGVFDLLHIEHFRFLEKAKNAGDRMIVGVETDQRVQSLKGGMRPINEREIRLEQLEALKVVDLAFALPEKFNSQSDWELFMDSLKPDVYAVSSGSPYLENKLAICRKFGIRFQVVHRHNPKHSSSMLVTRLLHPHDAGSPSRYRARVIPGQGRGKIMGFPTVNLKIPEDFPYHHGIYAGYVWLKGKRYQGAFHFGPIPTFSQRRVSLEVFLLHRKRDIAEKIVTFQLVQYLRPILTFSCQNRLLEQIQRDIELAKIVLA
jgi:cytidyltransferase-like protein